MFKDRVDAAQKLCQKLSGFLNKKNTLVVGLTRGGIVTASVVSKFLSLKLRALVVKKIGVPGNQELAIGAVVSARDIYWNEDLVKRLIISSSFKRYLQSQKVKEINLLKKEIGIKTKRNEFEKKDIILVDDGIATGMSVMAALKYLKRNGAKKVILAAPVIAADTFVYIKKYFDRVIYLKKAKDFYAISQVYENFPQVESKDVSKLLANSLQLIVYR